jgi:hypothetical protein
MAGRPDDRRPRFAVNGLDLWAALSGAGGYLALRFDNETYWIPASGRESFCRKLKAWGYAGDLEVFPIRFREKSLNSPISSSVLWARVEGPAGRFALDEFQPAPSVILAAGARRDALWALSGELTRRWCEALNRRLAHRLGGKLKDASPWFSFSPPGVVLRAGRKRPVSVAVERWDGELHSARDVAGGLDDPPERSEVWKARLHAA